MFIRYIFNIKNIDRFAPACSVGVLVLGARLHLAQYPDQRRDGECDVDDNTDYPEGAHVSETLGNVVRAITAQRKDAKGAKTAKILEQE